MTVQYNLFLLLISFCFIKSSLKFNVPSYRDKCFQHDQYLPGALLLRYDLTGYEQYFKGPEEKELFNNIKIFIKNQKGQNVFETSLKGRKDKFVAFLREADNYLVCVRYFKPRRGKELPGNVLMGLKIRSDYDYTDIDNSLHREDVNNFWRKIRAIKKDMSPSIESAKQELQEEDKTAKSMISSINTYYKLCCVQLVIILVLTIYIVITYQDFFKKKSLI